MNNTLKPFYNPTKNFNTNGGTSYTGSMSMTGSIGLVLDNPCKIVGLESILTNLNIRGFITNLVFDEKLKQQLSLLEGELVFFFTKPKIITPNGYEIIYPINLNHIYFEVVDRIYKITSANISKIEPILMPFSLKNNVKTYGYPFYLSDFKESDPFRDDVTARLTKINLKYNKLVIE